MGQLGFTGSNLSKDEDEKANSVDPDQTAPSGAVWSGYALTGKQSRPWSDCSFWSSLTWVCTVCSDLSVPILITFMTCWYYIYFILQRLAIAREFGDKAAERRAYSNLGNAHVFLGEFEVAAEHYRWVVLFWTFNETGISEQTLSLKYGTVSLLICDIVFVYSFITCSFLLCWLTEQKTGLQQGLNPGSLDQ